MKACFSFGQNLCNKKSILILLIIVLLAGITGCSKRYSNLPAFSALPIYDAQNNSVGRFKTSYLADQLDSYYRGYTSGPIAVTTFVDLNNLYGSSTFGRVLSEQLISEMSMRGYQVVEVRHSEIMQVMMGQGEFGLSQEMRVLRKSQELSGIVVGTYSVSPERVYINVRLIDPGTSLVRSAGSVELVKNNEIEKMLRTNVSAAALERIPVRALATASSPASWQHYPLESMLRQSLTTSSSSSLSKTKTEAETNKVAEGGEDKQITPRL